MDSAIDTCIRVRAATAEIVTEALQKCAGGSEATIADTINASLAAIPGLLPYGWYDPPPGGTAVLIGKPDDHFGRTRFDSLRKREYWPNPNFILGPEDVGIIYSSPIAENGIIGDWGATLYVGSDQKIRSHLVECLSVVESLAEYSAVGMAIGDISRCAEKLLRKHHLASDRTLLLNRHDATGINGGHTIPWSNEPMGESEGRIVAGGDKSAVNKLISGKRVYLNANETMTIPETIAFTTELRLESLADPELPNVFFHLIVSFENGAKTITSNFNPFFEAVGMDYIKSKY